jgi:prepilin peptidase CpaA
MALAEVGRWAVALALTVVLVWASVSDIRARKIPNWTVLATLGLFAPWALVSRDPWLLALAAGLIALAVSFALYAFGAVGAGDSKLFAAVALFAGLGHLAQMAFITVFAGGVIAAVSLASRPRRALVMLTMRGKGDFGRGIPYGVAIAIGAAWVVWSAVLGFPLPDRL